MSSERVLDAHQNAWVWSKRHVGSGTILRALRARARLAPGPWASFPPTRSSHRRWSTDLIFTHRTPSLLYAE